MCDSKDNTRSDRSSPDVIIPLVEPNLKYNIRGSYQPPGYTPDTKETLLFTGQEPSLENEEQKRATKRKSYVPVGFVLKRTDPLPSSSDSASSKRRSYMPRHHHGPLIKVDLKRPVTYTGDFLLPDVEKNAVVPSTTSKSRTIVGKSRSSSHRNKRSSLIINKPNPTLINLEAGVSIKSKVKAVDHSIIAKYKPDDPSFFLDPENMVIIRAVFCFITVGYIAWCLYYQHLSFFSSLLGYCYIGYFFYFLLSIAETLWFIDNRRTIMFPYQPEITEILFVCMSALAFVTPFIYWAFDFWVHIRTPSELSMIQVQDLTGVHLALFLVIPEIFLSRREVDKMFAVAPSIAIVAYQFLVWVQHYIFNWDWPFSLTSYFVNFLQLNMSPISLFIALLVSSLMTAACTMFVYICCWYRGRFQKIKLKKLEKGNNMT